MHQATPITLEWTTASEVNTAGFNVYRSDTADGAYTKINSQLIPSSSDPVAGGKYRYDDVTVVAGQTYYYRLEDIEFTGKSTLHGPIVVTAPAKLEIGVILGMLAGFGILVALGKVFDRARQRSNRSPTHSSS